MTDSRSLDKLLAAALAYVARMTPDERREMLDTQAESYARSVAPCEHGWRDFEQCPHCGREARND